MLLREANTIRARLLTNGDIGQGSGKRKGSCASREIRGQIRSGPICCRKAFPMSEAKTARVPQEHFHRESSMLHQTPKARPLSKVRAPPIREMIWLCREQGQRASDYHIDSMIGLHAIRSVSKNSDHGPNRVPDWQQKWWPPPKLCVNFTVQNIDIESFGPMRVVPQKKRLTSHNRQEQPPSIPDESAVQR